MVPLLLGACASKPQGPVVAATPPARSVPAPAPRPAPILAVVSMVPADVLALSPADLEINHAYNAVLEGDYAAAASNCRNALSFRPNDPAALLNLGAALQALGRPAAAARVYAEAARLGGQDRPLLVSDPHLAGHSVAEIARLALERLAQK